MSATEPGTIKRIDEISMLKGLGILFVMIFHMLTISGLAGACETVRKLHTILGLPVMIYFFMISGYLSKANKPGALIALRGRALRLLIPYYQYSLLIIAVLALIYLCIERRSLSWFADGTIGILFQFQSFHFFDKTSQWFHPMFYPVVEGWFLFQLIVSEVLFIPVLYMIKNKNKITKIMIAVILLVAGAILYVLDLQRLNGQFFPTVCKIFILPNIVGIAALLFIGNYMADQKLLGFDKYTARTKAVMTLACLAVMALFAVTDDFLYDFPIGKWGAFGAYSYILTPIDGAAVLLLFGIICNCLKKMQPVKKALIFMGDNSMDYLVLHFFAGFLTAYIGGFWVPFLEEPVPVDDIGINILHFVILMTCAIASVTIVIKLKKHFRKIIAEGERNG